MAHIKNFSSSSIHVKRSRTFNVSDVQDQLSAIGNHNMNLNNNNNNGPGNSKTLPKQLRNAKLKSSSRDSSELISTGLYRQSSPSSISVGTMSGTSSTASSRKSSNSSSNGGSIDPNVRTQINQVRPFFKSQYLFQKRSSFFVIARLLDTHSLLLKA